mgnify:FL=1
MLKETLIELFDRDLKKLIAELNLYNDEYDVWVTKEGISNSGGNLCLHLVGNLNDFIGATLGNTGYVRHRDDEFSLKNVLRQDLILNIENCILVVNNTLQNLSEEVFLNDFPLEKHGQIVSNTHMLLHLYGHLNYHLGQVNYHRRLIG